MYLRTYVHTLTSILPFSSSGEGRHSLLESTGSVYRQSACRKSTHIAPTHTQTHHTQSPTPITPNHPQTTPIHTHCHLGSLPDSLTYHQAARLQWSTWPLATDWQTTDITQSTYHYITPWCFSRQPAAHTKSATIVNLPFQRNYAGVHSFRFQGDTVRPELHCHLIHLIHTVYVTPADTITPSVIDLACSMNAHTDTHTYTYLHWNTHVRMYICTACIVHCTFT